MALFKIAKGTEANLTKNKPNTTEGYCYVTTDTKKFYVDTTTATGTSGRICLNAENADTVNGHTVAINVPANAKFTDTDTKNTAGSTDTSSKIYLVGAASQAASPQTYSDNQIYATNGQLDANKVRVAEAVTLQYNSTEECLNFVFA